MPIRIDRSGSPERFRLVNGWVEGELLAHCFTDLAFASAHAMDGAFERNSGNELRCDTTCDAVIHLAGVVHGDRYAIGAVFDCDLELGHSILSRVYSVVVFVLSGLIADQCSVEDVLSWTKMLAMSKGMDAY